MLEIPNHRINTKEGEGYLCVSPTKTCLATMTSKVGTWLNWDHVRLVAIVIVLQLFFTCWCYQFKRYYYYVRAIFFAKCDFLVVLKWPTSTGKRGGVGEVTTRLAEKDRKESKWKDSTNTRHLYPFSNGVSLFSWNQEKYWAIYDFINLSCQIFVKYTNQQYNVSLYKSVDPL